MAISVRIDLGKKFAVKAPAAEVFALLADVPRSVRHFPNVERLTDLGDGAYRWEMQKGGTPRVHIQTVYACKYVADAAQGTVVWTPVRGVGNAVVSGHWQLAARQADAKGQAEGTDIELAIQATIALPLPGLVKTVVTPIVESEFKQRVDQYIDKLIRVFGGEA